MGGGGWGREREKCNEKVWKYVEHFVAKMTIPFLERAKAVPGCAEMRGRLCSKPMVESLQSKHCAEPTRKILRGDPHKY